MVDTINVRSHKKPSYKRSERYFNYEAEVVDGVVKYEKKPVVAPSMASDFSATINAITRSGSSELRKRVNIDAVDVPHYVKSIEENSNYSK